MKNVQQEPAQLSEYLDQLENLTKEATKGPWTVYQSELDLDYDSYNILDSKMSYLISDIELNDAKFIAAFNPQTIKAMIIVMRAVDMYLRDPMDMNTGEGIPMEIMENALNNLESLIYEHIHS